jgi:hypothetical protein
MKTVVIDGVDYVPRDTVISDATLRALAQIKLRDEMAIAAMRSLIGVAGDSESMKTIAEMAYRVADHMMDARHPGVDGILKTYIEMNKAGKKPEAR